MLVGIKNIRLGEHSPGGLACGDTGAPFVPDPCLELSSRENVSLDGSLVLEWVDRSALARTFTPLTTSTVFNIWPGGLPEIYGAGQVDIAPNPATGVSFAISAHLFSATVDRCILSIKSPTQIFELWVFQERLRVWDGVTWWYCGVPEEYMHVSANWSEESFNFYINGVHSRTYNNSLVPYFNDWTSYRLGTSHGDMAVERFNGAIVRHDFCFYTKSESEHVAWNTEITTEFP